MRRGHGASQGKLSHPVCVPLRRALHDGAVTWRAEGRNCQRHSEGPRPLCCFRERLVGTMTERKVVCVQDPESGWTARVLDVPGAVTEGDTEAELETNVRDLLMACSEDPNVDLVFVFVESPLVRRVRKNPATMAELRQHFVWELCSQTGPEDLERNVAKVARLSDREVRRRLRHMKGGTA